MLIKHKLYANTGLLLVSLLAMALLLFNTKQSLQQDIELTRNIDEIAIAILELRRNEKDFLARKDLKYVEKFSTNSQRLNADISKLIGEYQDHGFATNNLQALGNITKQYQTLFEQLVKAQQTIGLTPKTGLYGKLRDAVHDAEALIGDQDPLVLSSMLQLRRAEKDFMLRSDEKYVGKLSSHFKTIQNQLAQAQLDDKPAIKQALDNYLQAFNNLVAAQKTLGLDPKSGLLGEVRTTVHQVDEILATVTSNHQQNIDAFVAKITTFATSLFLLIFVIASATAIWITRTIVQGIANIQQAMQHIADNNDYSVNLPIHQQDELWQMTQVFNTMMESFRQLLAQVQQSVTTLNIATEQLATNIAEANHGVSSQIQETDMVATAVTEMVATIEGIADNTNEAAVKAENTNTSAIQGNEVVNTAITQIKQLSQELMNSELVVQQLDKDSETIGSVLDVIRGIAEQTNLLALNAAIEAARAGEQGRGFAVVADEVRTLASRTQESTKEIETIIHSLQLRTKDIVQRMGACRTQGDNSSKHAAEAGDILANITQDVETILNMNSAIATAIQEQTTVASEINKHVVSIRDVAEHAGDVAHQNEQMSEELTQQAELMQQEIVKFKV